LVCHIKEKHRLRAFYDRELRMICGPKRDEVTGESRRLHKEIYHLVLLTKYYSVDKIKKETGEVLAGMGEGYVHAEFSWGKLR
jgi:hypothetical protein